MSCPRGCCATYREHLTSVVISTGPVPQSRKESALSRDLDAYKRMVQSGAQPASYVGAAALEKTAEIHHEVELAHSIKNKRVRRQVAKALEVAPPPAVTPIDAP